MTETWYRKLTQNEKPNYKPEEGTFQLFNIYKLTNLIKFMNIKILQHKYDGVKIVQVTKSDDIFQLVDHVHETNSILVVCAYLVCDQRMTPVAALKLFEGIQTATYVKDPLATYNLEIIDYLEALEFAIQQGWYDYKRFDASGYLHYNNFNNGDINWIVPNLILAFSGPSDQPSLNGPTPSNSCHLVLTKLQECGVNTIIRLNEPEYERVFFLQNNIDHEDIIFEDGTVPNEVSHCHPAQNFAFHANHAS